MYETDFGLSSGCHSVDSKKICTSHEFYFLPSKMSRSTGSPYFLLCAVHALETNTFQQYYILHIT